MGSIPIVKFEINTQFYSMLPILYVSDWEEVTPELLVDMWEMFKDGVWDEEILTFNYWKNKIRNYVGD